MNEAGSRRFPLRMTEKARRVLWYPTQAKTGLEWGTQVVSHSRLEWGTQPSLSVKKSKKRLTLSGSSI
jgi:hypothetical protein